MKVERTIKVVESKEGYTVREEWKDETGLTGVGQVFLTQAEIDFLYVNSKMWQYKMERRGGS